jgi:tetratricopeptide (TPR) repeat protein/cold shock CspA family protein
MPDARLEQAAAAAGRKEWDRAADLLAAAPQTDEIVDKHGWYLSRAKRYEEAIQVFLELRRRRPSDYLPPYMIGFQHYNQEQWRESLQWFDEALAHKPEHIKSMWRRAHALERLGEDVEAAMAAGGILRLWHELPPSRQEEDRKLVGRASFLLGRRQMAHDPAGAAELLAQAAELEPDDPFKHYKLAKALRRSGRPRDALGPAERAARMKLGDPNIAVEYAAALHAHARSAEAVQALARVARRCTGWKAYQAGALALQAGDVRLAVEFLSQAGRDRAVRADPRVMSALAEATAKAGSPSAAEPRTEGRRRDRPSVHEPHNATNGHGRVDVVRPDRGFGFLVDDAGVRRHFRLDPSASVGRGQEVLFTPVVAKKGPAAVNVRAA